MLYNDKKFIGSKIKEYRKKHHLTQEKLAELVGISDKHVGRIEAGTFFPACNTFLHLIDILKIDIRKFGIDLQTQDIIDKTELLKIIYGMSERETNFFLPIVKVILTEYRKRNESG